MWFESNFLEVEIGARVIMGHIFGPKLARKLHKICVEIFFSTNWRDKQLCEKILRTFYVDRLNKAVEGFISTPLLRPFC